MPHDKAQALAALQSDVDILAGTTPDTVLASLPQWDSLAILLTLSHFEQTYKVELSGPRIRVCRTVGELLDLIPPQL